MDEGQKRVRDACARLPRGRGLYVWGPVGRGKSMLIDEYFETIRKPKVRFHFHDFFTSLHAHYMRAGQRVDRAVDNLLGSARVVLFDEFHVHDIGDAMLLDRVIREFVSRRIALLATSNYPPDGLLSNRLFHHKFVPTIDLLTSTMDIVDIGTGVDYRTRSAHSTGFASGWWVTPNTVVAQSLTIPDTGPVTLCPAGRPVTASGVDGFTVWFDFAELCERPTSPADYVALTTTFSRWILLDVPSLARASADASIRFANLVDVLSDRDIETVFVSEGPPDTRLVEHLPQFEEARLASRLGQLRTTTELAEPTARNRR